MQEKGTQATEFSVQFVKITLYYLNVTDPLIIPLVFNPLPCDEKAHDNKKLL